MTGMKTRLRQWSLGRVDEPEDVCVGNHGIAAAFADVDALGP